MYRLIFGVGKVPYGPGFNFYQSLAKGLPRKRLISYDAGDYISSEVLLETEKKPEMKRILAAWKKGNLWSPSIKTAGKIETSEEIIRKHVEAYTKRMK